MTIGTEDYDRFSLNLPFSTPTTVQLGEVGALALSPSGTYYLNNYPVWITVNVCAFNSSCVADQQTLSLSVQDLVSNGEHTMSITSTTTAAYGPLTIPGITPDGSYLEEGILTLSVSLGPIVTLADNAVTEPGQVPFYVTADLEPISIVVPEPQSIWMLGIGTILLVVARRLKYRSSHRKRPCTTTYRCACQTERSTTLF
jgi:hypothetical protein